MTTRWGMQACSCCAQDFWTPSATWRSFSECATCHPGRPWPAPPSLWFWGRPCPHTLAAGSFQEGALRKLPILLCGAGAVTPIGCPGLSSGGRIFLLGLVHPKLGAGLVVSDRLPGGLGTALRGDGPQLLLCCPRPAALQSHRPRSPGQGGRPGRGSVGWRSDTRPSPGWSTAT